jgi:Terminase large subunit, T4likevirus-type, N-terminal
VNTFLYLAHALDPALWSADVLGLDLDPWQALIVRQPPGSRSIALVHRQAGKTSAAAVAIGHTIKFERPGTTSLALAPTLRQSAELIRRLRGMLLAAGASLIVDNAFSLEVAGGSRCIAMPGENDAAIRGFSVDGTLVIDEAARVPDALYDAARPMLIRHAAAARLMIVSTAWARQGFFYRIWSEGEGNPAYPADWARIEATIEQCRHLSPELIERERRSMPAAVFNREYLNQFDSLESRFFDVGSIDAAFGSVIGPTPEVADDPVRSRQPAFAIRVSQDGFP